jgi:hypothetical protein
MNTAAILIGSVFLVFPLTIVTVYFWGKIVAWFIRKFYH